MAYRMKTYALALLTLFLLGFAPGVCRADEKPWQVVEHAWYVLEIGGAPMGAIETLVEQQGDCIRTTSRQDIRMQRLGAATEVSMESVSVETEAGEPIEIATSSKMASSITKTTWSFEEDGIHATTVANGRETKKTLALPESFLMPWAAHRHVTEQIGSGTDEIMFSLLDPSFGAKPMKVRMQRVQPEEGDADAPGISHWKTTTDAIPIAGEEIYDAEGALLEQRINAGIGEMVTKRASEEQARAALGGEAPELMVATFIQPDAPIDVMQGSLTFRLRARNGELPELPNTAAQRVIREGGNVAVVTVTPGDPMSATDAERSDAAYLEDSAAIGHGDELVKKLAVRAVRGKGEDARACAEAMRRFVHRHISEKGYETAFASAAEVARRRTGDCSEHAVLLAAMLRAKEIPSRAATGLLYLRELGGENGAFGWHMWTQALIDGKWLDLDATLRHPFDAGHIVTSTSALSDEGDLAEMASIMLLIGNLDIAVVKPAEGEATPESTSAAQEWAREPAASSEAE